MTRTATLLCLLVLAASENQVDETCLLQTKSHDQEAAADQEGEFEMDQESAEDQDGEFEMYIDKKTGKKTGKQITREASPAAASPKYEVYWDKKTGKKRSRRVSPAGPAAAAASPKYEVYYDKKTGNKRSRRVKSEDEVDAEDQEYAEDQDSADWGLVRQVDTDSRDDYTCELGKNYWPHFKEWKNIEIGSLKECQALCEKNPACAVVVYTAGRECFLKTNKGGVKSALRDIISCERKNAPDVANYRCSGGNWVGQRREKKVKHVQTRQHCQALCDSEKWCGAIVWVSHQGNRFIGDCWLKSDAPRQGIVGPGFNDETCWREKRTPSHGAYSCAYGQNYVGQDREWLQKGVMNKDLCMELCDDNPSCNLIVYNNKQECWMKTNYRRVALLSALDLTNPVSCVRQSRPSHSHFDCKKNANYLGQRHEEMIKHVPNLDACQAHCDRHGWCTTVVYNTKQECWMKTNHDSRRDNLNDWFGKPTSCERAPAPEPQVRDLCNEYSAQCKQACSKAGYDFDRVACDTDDLGNAQCGCKFSCAKFKPWCQKACKDAGTNTFKANCEEEKCTCTTYS